MKRLLAAVLCTAVLLGLAGGVHAADCDHEYVALSLEADCQNKARTVYTCSLCGDTYTVYADEYTAPDGMYLLLSSTRTDSTINVNCYYFNNAGLSGAQMPIYFDPSAVAVDSVVNGEVWTAENYVNGIEWTPGSDHVTMYAESEGNDTNTNNGLCFTVIFNMLDGTKDPGIYLKTGSRYYVDWDNETNRVIDRAPQIIDIIGKSDLGDHKYVSVTVPPTCTETGETTETCSVCGDTHTQTLESLGHNFTLGACARCGIADPDAHTVTVDGNSAVYSVGDTVQLSGAFYTDGAKAYRFVCWQGDTDVLTDEGDGNAVFTMPERDITITSVYLLIGDVNSDGRINGTDLNFMKRIFTGTLDPIASADVNLDGRVNGTDINYLSRMLLGTFTPDK